MLTLIYTSIIATLLATVLVVALRPLAIRLQLVDRPNDRKFHEGEVPLIGGPVIWLVVMLGVFTFVPDTPWSLIFASGMLVVLGVLDDRQPVSAKIKLLFHFAAAAILIMGNGNIINNIGIFNDLFGNPENRELHIAFTILAIAIAINAFNFIDGIDGLSSSMALLALTHINLTFNILHGETPEDFAFFSVLISGALAGFLLFNLQVFNGRKIFLGDSGSMLVGMLVAFALINASQKGVFSGPKIAPSLCLWLIAIPLTDMLTIIMRRLFSGRSPMAPDRTHLHHILMKAGFSARRTLLMMILSSVGAFWIGFGLSTHVGELASIIGFFAFMALYYFAAQRAHLVVAFLK